MDKETVPQSEYNEKETVDPYNEKPGAYGGADRQDSAARKMSATEMAAETARRQSVAVNIVENPLRVCHT